MMLMVNHPSVYLGFKHPKLVVVGLRNPFLRKFQSSPGLLEKSGGVPFLWGCGQPQKHHLFRTMGCSLTSQTIQLLGYHHRKPPVMGCCDEVTGLRKAVGLEPKSLLQLGQRHLCLLLADFRKEAGEPPTCIILKHFGLYWNEDDTEKEGWLK